MRSSTVLNGRIARRLTIASAVAGPTPGSRSSCAILAVLMFTERDEGLLRDEFDVAISANDDVSRVLASRVVPRPCVGIAAAESSNARILSAVATSCCGLSPKIHGPTVPAATTSAILNTVMASLRVVPLCFCREVMRRFIALMSAPHYKALVKRTLPSHDRKILFLVPLAESVHSWRGLSAKFFLWQKETSARRW